MVIGVDAGSLSITDERLKVGVWRVTFKLLKELGQMDMTNTYRLYSFAPIDREVMKVFGPRMENKVITPAAGWSSFWLPLELKRRPVDIFLGLSQSLPNVESHNIDCRNVLTNVLQSCAHFSTPKKSAQNELFRKMASIGFVYDLAFLYTPDAYGSSYHKLKKQTDDLVKRANRIITISESSKSDIVTHYKIPDDRVTVCYPGVEKKIANSIRRPLAFSQGDALRKNPYFLFVGSLNKAKDISLTIESFAIFLKKIKKPYDFLLVGGDYWPDPAIDESIHRFKLNDRIKKVGFVDDALLPLYYRGATAFFTTAIREGFCLPAVESMACGTPVVSVDRGAMKEVVGEGGLIASDLSPEKIADMLYTIATNSEVRVKLKKQALKRAKLFSWKSFATCVMTMYP